MRPLIRPSMRPNAFVVDDLRDKLPPTCLKMPEIRRLLALSETTLLDEAEILAGLLYLEQRGEVARATGRGWKLSNLNSSPYCHGGRSNHSGPPAITLFDSHVTYDREGNLV